MADRGVYYARDGKLYCRRYTLSWDLGFDRYAKHEYFKQCKSLLGDSCGKIAEVTSSAEYLPTRNLSPIFVMMRDGSGLSVEDYLRQLAIKIPNIFELSPLTNWIYIINLSDKNLKTIHEYDAYSDIFNDPTKGWGNSQAESIATLRALEQCGKVELLKNFDAFQDWYVKVPKLFV